MQLCYGDDPEGGPLDAIRSIRQLLKMIGIRLRPLGIALEPCPRYRGDNTTPYMRAVIMDQEIEVDRETERAYAEAYPGYLPAYVEKYAEGHRPE